MLSCDDVEADQRVGLRMTPEHLDRSKHFDADEKSLKNLKQFNKQQSLL